MSSDERHSCAIDAAGTPICYEWEEDNSGTLRWLPIDTIGGAAIFGSRVYVETNDGVFWEYDTIAGSAQDSAGYVLEGYSGSWPRYRKNNLGAAREY
jgi:hypothetical protein